MNSIQISNSPIREINGLFSLNDLHRASGNEKRHQPSNWLQNQQTIDFINECEKTGNPVIFKKQGLGTFVCKELVIHYAMWISPQFSLQVIQTFLHTMKTPQPEPTIQTETDMICLLARLANYAKSYGEIQKMLCDNPHSPQSQQLLNAFSYSTNVNQTGFLFVFKPDVARDVQTAFDLLHQYAQHK